MLLQSVAECGMLLQSVAEFCMLLQSVAECGMLLQSVAEFCMLLQSVAGSQLLLDRRNPKKKTQISPQVWLLQTVAERGSVWLCAAVCSSV